MRSFRGLGHIGLTLNVMCRQQTSQLMHRLLTSCSHPPVSEGRVILNLLLKLLDSFFRNAYFVLQLPRVLFNISFGFRAAVVGDFPNFLFNCALHFVTASLNLVFCACFHIAPRSS